MKTSNNNACFECGSGELVHGVVELVGSRQGEVFTVLVSGLACASCGFKTIDNSQSGEFTKAVSDAYRAAHGLLTGAEIKARRSALKMSQQVFADHLGGVGRISVSRWESGHVQDRAMDELIRLKTDPQAARNNLKALEFQVPEEYIVSSIKVGEEDLDLLFSLEQTFTPHSPIKMGKLRIDPPIEQTDLLAA